MKKMFALLLLFVFAFGISACAQEDTEPLQEENPELTPDIKKSEANPYPTYPVYPPMPVGS